MTRAMADLLRARDHLAAFFTTAREPGWLEAWVLRKRQFRRTPLHLLSPAQLRCARRKLQGWRAGVDPVVGWVMKRRASR